MEEDWLSADAEVADAGIGVRLASNPAITNTVPTRMSKRWSLFMKKLSFGYLKLKSKELNGFTALLPPRPCANFRGSWLDYLYASAEPSIPDMHIIVVRWFHPWFSRYRPPGQASYALVAK